MKKILKRGLSIVMSMALAVGLLPVMTEPVTAHATMLARNVNLNMDGTIQGISNPVIPSNYTSNWQGTYVYYGKDKYRVLDAATTDYSADGITKTMLLDCDSALFTKQFDATSNDWETSGVKSYLNGEFLNNHFDSVEKSAIAPSAIGAENRQSWSDPFGANYQSLSGEKLFLLDLGEVTHSAYGYMDGMNGAEAGKVKMLGGATSGWWLRTFADPTNNVCIDPDGTISTDSSTSPKGVAPALNVNLSSVLFTSEAGKTKASSFQKTTGSDSNQWNLTLTGGNGLVAARKSGETGLLGSNKTMTVNVSNLGTAVTGVNYTQLSAMLVDSYGIVVSYGKIADIADGVVKGTNVSGNDVTVTIPSGISVGDYTLKVFAEDVNSASSADATDYASNMAEIPVKIAAATTQVPNVGTTNETSYKACDGTITDVADTMEYKSSTEENYTPVVTGKTEIKDLAPETYQVRYRETDTLLAGADKEVTIAAKNPELLSITQPSAITGISNGAPLTGGSDSVQAALPTKVAIETEDTSIKEADVVWNVASVTGYDPAKIMEQTFTVSGVVTLPNGVDNSLGKSLTTSVSVTVMEGHIAVRVTAIDGSVTGYGDFQSAWFAAQSVDGSTIQLLDDVTYNSDMNAITVLGKRILDLNGHTLQMNGALGHIQLGSKTADLTVRDSKTGGGGNIRSLTDFVFVVDDGKLTVNGGIFSTTAPMGHALQINGDAAKVCLSGGTFSQIYKDTGSLTDILANGCLYYDADGIVDITNQSVIQNVTINAIDWNQAVTYNADQKTYTVLSADGLRWISGVTNGTVKEETYQNDPALPTDSSFKNCTVLLGEDIDLSGKEWTPIGGTYNFHGVGGFAGDFDGAGHKITNMSANIKTSINDSSIMSGLFTAVSGTVKNLAVSGSITITGEDNCIIRVGGITGYARSAKIENCISDVDIAITEPSGLGYAGGLIGNGTFEMANCISGGIRTISGGISGNIGGVSGSNGVGTTIRNCYYAKSGDTIGNGGYVILISCGTYEKDGSLTALSDQKLSYGDDLKTACNNWVMRQGSDAAQYVTWSTDVIPALTTVYATGHTHQMGAWMKQVDGTYTRTCSTCGYVQTAQASVTLGDSETPYATIEEAITAAQEEDGSVVKLLSDIFTKQTIEVDSGTFTIDLGGRLWISCATTGLLVKGSSHMTIKDSVGGATVWNTAEDQSISINIQSAQVTIEGGAYYTSYGIALNVQGTGKVLKGGFFSSITTDGLIGDLLGYDYAYETIYGTWVSNINVNTISNIYVSKEPVNITSQPEDTTLTYGYSNAPALNLAANSRYPSTSEITYQWYKDDTLLTGETSASYMVPVGLDVGDYHFYCVASLDGYTVKSSTATVTINKQEGSIANKEIGGYATAYTYTGSSIAEPSETNFTTTNEGAMIFTWYKGDTTSEDARLASAPSKVGTYTLKVDAPESSHNKATSTTIKVTIDYFETSDAAILSGTQGEPGWYTSDVTVGVPDGYVIALSNGDDASWSSSLSVKTDRTGDYTYYLKQSATGYITDAKTVTINRDTKIPVLRYVITATDSTVTDQTATIDFRSSEAGSYYYSVVKSNVLSAPSVNELVTSDAHVMESGKNTLNLSGLSRNTEYTLYLAGKDVAGNLTGEVTAISFETTKTSLANAVMALTKSGSALKDDSFIYNGMSQIPDVSVQVGGLAMDASQYAISYSNTNGGSGNTTNAGTITVTLAAKADSDYTGTISATYVIAKKAVEVTAANLTKQYGQTNPELILQPIADGQLIGADTVDDLHITLSTIAGTASEAGNYDITGNANSSNYNVTVHQGTLTITKIDAALSVGSTEITKTNGERAFAIGALTTGTASLSYVSSNTAVATVNAGIVTIKGIGIATITVFATGSSYNTATKTITITVKPSVVKTSSLKASGSKKLSLSWKKDSKASGYQIAYSTSNKFTAKTTKTVTVSSYKTLSKTISNLKSGKKYYVHIRSYKSIGKTKIYADWSKTASVKVK